MKILYGLCLCTALVGCADQPVTTRVVTQRVEVPVPVKPTPPPELATCPGRLQPITFYVPSDPRYSAALDKAGMQNLRDFGDHVVACIRAWRAWAAP